MKLTPRTLLFVIGIPAGYLPLLAAVESGPAEVGATLFLITAFGCLEALHAERTAGDPKWPRAVFRAARVAAAYAVGCSVGLSAAAITAEPEGPTWFQRMLFGDFGGPLGESGFASTIMIFRLAALWLCALVSWGQALAVVVKYKGALGLALGDTPVVCGGLWFALSELGPVAPARVWLRPLVVLVVVGIPLLIAVRLRRRASCTPSAEAARSARAAEPALARPTYRIQFSVGALLALVAVCALWSGLALYASREPRRQRFFSTLPVTGKVTYKGRPVAGALVRFHPTHRTLRPASGTTDDGGAFEAQTLTRDKRPVSGVQGGEYIVTIAPAGTDGPQPPAGAPALEEIVVPPRYADPASSRLTAAVQFGRLNHFAFDLDAEAEP